MNVQVAYEGYTDMVQDPDDYSPSPTRNKFKKAIKTQIKENRQNMKIGKDKLIKGKFFKFIKDNFT